jgi:predicted nucleotidyltransferase
MEVEQGYEAFFKRREAEKKNLREIALKEAANLSGLLKKNFEYETLFLIGSVAKGRGFHRHSDIDFVIKGLKKELFFKALALMMKSSFFAIDLKPWEELDEESRARVEAEGRVLP